MKRSRVLWLLLIALLAVLCLVWLLWRIRPKTTAPAQGEALTTEEAVAKQQAGSSTTTLYAHNIRLRKGPDFRVYIRWIRGEMQRTHPHDPPSFDDPESFVLEIQKGVIHANIGDIANYLNAAAPPDAALKKISIEPAGEQLKIHGTAHKIISLPVELTGTLSAVPDGRVKFHAEKISVLKIPMKGLLGSFHIELSDLVHATNIKGIELKDNDIYFDTQQLLPPPHIHGNLTSVTVRPPDIEVIYGNTPNDDTQLAQWHNFLRLRGGTVEFGKLTMHHADLTMIDTSQKPWFDLDLVNYQEQLVNGYSRMTPQAGLEIFMPDLDSEAGKKQNHSITLEWLKNRNRSLPEDVPVKR